MASIEASVQRAGKGKGHVAKWETGRGRAIFDRRCAATGADLKPGTLNLTVPGRKTAVEVENVVTSILGEPNCLGSQFKWKFLTPFCVSPPAVIAS